VSQSDEIETCHGAGELLCLDVTKRGNISERVAGNGDHFRENPQSGLIWRYRGGKNGHKPMHRSLGGPAAADDLIVIPDCDGVVHVLDAITGEVHWTYSTNEAIHGAPLIVGSKVFIGTESGSVYVFSLSTDGGLLAKSLVGDAPIETGLVFANDEVIVMSRNKLWVVKR